MLNVLEHIKDDVNALKNAFNLLKPGGTLIIEVPAGPCLYDSYDTELQHFRRYSTVQLKSSLIEAGFEIFRLSHLAFVLFPAFALVKLFNKWLPSKQKKGFVSGQASRTSSNLLVKIGMYFETRWLSGFRLPVGIRILAVAKRR